MIGLVVDAVLEGHVDRVVFAVLGPDLVAVAGAREEVLGVLVETDRHHPIRAVECLLDPVTMVHVNIQVHHSRVILQQLDNCFFRVLHNLGHNL